MAQQPINQVRITSFVVKKKLPADVAAWAANGTFLNLSAQRNPQSAGNEIKFTVQVKQAAIKICGNNAQSAPLTDLKTMRNFSVRTIIAGLNNCNKLSPGAYTICIRFYNADNYPVSGEVCRDFVVDGPAEPAPGNSRGTGTKERYSKAAPEKQ